MSQPNLAKRAVSAQGGDGSNEQIVSALAAEFEELVSLRWRSYYPARSAAEQPEISLHPRHFGYSLIFRVELRFEQAETERFVIKMRRQQKHGTFLPNEVSDKIRALGRAEYHEHVKAHEFFAGMSEFGVVRPLDYIQSHNAIVVEHAAGEDLCKLVKRGSPITRTSLSRCGRWWRLFHDELQRATERPWDPEVIDERVDLRLRRLSAIGVPSTTLEAVRAEIAAAARAVSEPRVPVSRVHGDCKLRHVWATPAGIQVLDFGNAKQADCWVDPAALVVELCLNSLWGRRLDSAPKIKEIRAVLHAYFGGPPPLAFALYAVDVLLKKWHRRLRNWGPGAGLTRLRRSLETAGLDTPVERLYIDRWFTSQIRAWLALAEGRAPAWLRPVLE